MVGDDDRATLRQEFNGEDDSFLIKLRPGLDWDKEAFSRLITAMEQCCRQYAQNDRVERWLAHGFWYVPDFVRSWTSHPNFPHQYPQEYYDQAYAQLEDLAYWFFVGESPSIGDAAVDPL